MGCNVENGVKLEKISDIDIHLFLEKGMRGGVSCVSKRYSKSEKNALHSENIDIMYWDLNNLYGTVMSLNYLPYGGVKWLSKEEIKKLDLNYFTEWNSFENSKIGYILEVDLEYCKELHDTHNDYPLCPEHTEVKYEMLSKYCKDIVDRYNVKVGGVKKLISNLHDKIRYHYKNLKYYLSLGMKLVKIHRILKFKQKKWLKVFTNFNAKKRQESNNEFNKNFYKLFNNCVYGKSIENARKKINLKMANDKKEYLKIVNRPDFISQKITDKNFIAIVDCKKKVLTLNKPIYVGFCILELSNLLMYQFHYDYVLKTFNAKLLFTDTDSLVYEIKGGNVSEQCFKDKELFDFSGYDKNSIYFYDSNKKVLGKMKHEFNGNKIDEFVGLKSKMYSLISAGWEVNKVKGVNLKLKHKEYVDVLFNKKIVRHKMKRILSERHSIGSYVLNKVSLSCFDDKRFILVDGINSLAYGHKNIGKIK